MPTPPIIGFISPPAWYDPAPSEFPRVCLDEVLTQQAPLLLPDFDYALESVARVQPELNLCASSLKAMGCSLAAQVGSPFAWAGVNSEAEARRRCQSLAQAAGAPALMTSLAMVDCLRTLKAARLAVDCTYYDRVWRDGFVHFLDLCGFEVVHASTLADQGLVPASDGVQDYGWSMTPDLTRASVRKVAESSNGG